MEFLTWHYSSGVDFYLDHWKFKVRWLVHYFSLPLLFKSYFAPWKKLIIVEKTGFNLEKYFQKLSFNVISRVMGAIVRTFLLITGLLVILAVIIFGGLGLLIWLAIPVLSYPIYQRETNYLSNFIGRLCEGIKSNPGRTLSIVFDNPAGAFVLKHLSLDIPKLSEGLRPPSPEVISQLSCQTYKELIAWFINVYGLNEDYFRSKGMTAADLLFAADWWDQGKTRDDNDSKNYKQFGRPGIGLELLFGYTPNLNKYSLDLGIPQSFSHHLIGREEIVSRMERTMSSGSSVYLVGQPGVGKRTVVLEYAQRARIGLLGPQMSYRRVLEVDYNSFLSESRDLNSKKTTFATLLSEASYAGNVILVIRDIHRITNSEVEGYDFTDVFEKNLEGTDLQIIALLSSIDYERFVSTNPRLSKYFQMVEVTSPTGDEAMAIIMSSAEDLEVQKKIIILISTISRILEASDRYITDTPFPEKALELMDEVIVYAQRKGKNVIVKEDVDAVMSEKTGISFAQLTESTKDKLGHLEEIIQKKLIGQEMAVSLIARSLRASSVGVKSENKPIGSFLFLGPTGVGKTQTAKVLAEVYYGSEKSILRFDMAEFSGPEGLSRLIGSQARSQPGVLTTAIKNKPASLLLLDEIEKAPREILNLFLTLLDEGSMTDAFGRKINCKNLFVIATSNAGAEHIRETVGQGIKGEMLQKDLIDYVLRQGLFSPELLNRFDGVVVFEPIKMEDLPKISRLMLEELQNHLKQKNIYLDITPEVCQKIAQDGYDPTFGARPMRRVVDLVLGDLLGREILNSNLKEGDKIVVIPGAGREEYRIEKINN